MPDFNAFKTSVANQFKKMSVHDLFRTDVDRDTLWETYLTSFPEGTNQIYRKRTSHDCSCCRQFFGALGNAVAVINGNVTSVWDISVKDPAYQVVAQRLADLVKSRKISSIFLHPVGHAGIDKNFEKIEGGAKTWDHLFARLPNSRVCPGDAMGPKLSESLASHDVFLRGLDELKVAALDTTLELMGQGSLYRGDEFRPLVDHFRRAKLAYDKTPAAARDHFVWDQVTKVPPSLARFRNTAIGELVVELSSGTDLEAAVGRYEASVAPSNYKRTTALVTPAMIERARETVEGLGLTSALDRRYARLTDIAVDNVLFADRSAKRSLRGNVFDDLTATAPVRVGKLDKVEEIGIEKFLSDVVPRATTIEVLVENRHASNLVSLVAPADPSAAQLFKWPNGFSWSYHGDLTDSMKTRVKRAGGSVTGDLCCRLGWFNTDDLDLHLLEPGGGHISYVSKVSTTGGRLDVDMNAGRGTTREPVENIFYSFAHMLREGDYKLYVHQYNRRETTDVGFEAELDFRGEVYRFGYRKPLKSDERVTVAEFSYSRQHGLKLTKSLPATPASRKIWGVDTENFHRVSLLLLSPNHWDGHGVGNKHYFFMLDGCQNDETARGFYNEFLKPELDPHRKVLELVGAKMRTEETADQLSGLGFSSTQRDHLVARVTGSFSRTVRVTF